MFSREDFVGLLYAAVISAQKYSQKTGYVVDKEVIKNQFLLKDNTDYKNIYARLALIDSLYSTQMTKRYYGLGELAEVLSVINNGKDNITHLFCEFAADPKGYKEYFSYNKSDVKYFVDGREGDSNLFDEGFGLGKISGEDKGKALSLITKFAYFDTGFQFPIYDSIVKDVLPMISSHLGWDELAGKMPEDIVDFIERLNSFKEKLSKEIKRDLSYDELDQLLWHVGKVLRSNLSLILSMSDYKKNGYSFNIYRCTSIPEFFEPLSLTAIFKIAKYLAMTEECNLSANTIGSCESTLFKFYGKHCSIITPDPNKDKKKTLKQVFGVRKFIIRPNMTINDVRSEFENKGIKLMFSH